jgi:hypothetical protein
MYAADHFEQTYDSQFLSRSVIRIPFFGELMVGCRQRHAEPRWEKTQRALQKQEEKTL